MRLSEICEILNAEVLVGKEMLENRVFGGGSADLMDDVLAAVAKGAVILTGLTTIQVIQTAKIAEVAAIIFVRGKKPDKKVIEQAINYKLPVFLTSYSLFTASGLLYMNGLRGIDGSW